MFCSSENLSWETLLTSLLSISWPIKTSRLFIFWCLIEMIFQENYFSSTAIFPASKLGTAGLVGAQLVKARITGWPAPFSLEGLTISFLRRDLLTMPFVSGACVDSRTALAQWNRDKQGLVKFGCWITLNIGPRVFLVHDSESQIIWFTVGFESTWSLVVFFAFWGLPLNITSSIMF